MTPTIDSGTPGRLPKAYLPEKEKDYDWYIKAVNGILKRWVLGGNSLYDINSNSIYYQSYQYYFGEQDGGNFEYMRQAAQGVDLPATYIPGQQLTRFINYLTGNTFKQIEQYNVSAKSLNDEQRKQVKDMFDKASIYLKEKEFFSGMENISGIKYQPIPGQNPASQSDIDRLNKNWTLEGEKVSKALALTDMFKNNYTEAWIRIIFDAIMTGIGSCKVVTENGQTVWRYIPRPYAIVDNAPFSDTNLGAQYGGSAALLSIPEIIERYDLSPDQKQKLQDTAGSSADMLKANALYGFTWWYDIFTPVPKCTVVDIEFIDVKLTKKVASTYRKGNKLFEDTESLKNLNDNQLKNRRNRKLYNKEEQTVRFAVFIAGEFLSDWGERPNQVSGYKHLDAPELSFRNFTPQMMFGKSAPIGGRLQNLQDEIDIYEYMIRLAASRDMGKLINYASNLLPDQYETISDVIVKAKTDGVIEFDPTKAEDAALASNLNAGKFFQILDMGLKPGDVEAYTLMIDRKKREMEEIVSVPAMAMGQQTEITGKGVQQQTVAAASTGLLWLYKSFTQYINRFLMYSVNLSKLNYLSAGSYEGLFAVSDTEWDYLKIDKQFLIEDHLIFIQADNMIDEQARNLLLQGMFAMAQNGQVDMIDYIKALKTKSYNELIDELEDSLGRKKTEAMQQQMMAAQQEQAQIQSKGQQSIAPAQLAAQSSVQKTQIQEQGKNERQAEQSRAKIAQAILQHGSKAGIAEQLHQQEMMAQQHEQDHALNAATHQAVLDNMAEGQQQSE